jgi:hypothetical protein
MDVRTRSALRWEARQQVGNTAHDARPRSPASSNDLYILQEREREIVELERLPPSVERCRVCKRWVLTTLNVLPESFSLSDLLAHLVAACDDANLTAYTIRFPKLQRYRFGYRESVRKRRPFSYRTYCLNLVDEAAELVANVLFVNWEKSYVGGGLVLRACRGIGAC